MEPDRQIAHALFTKLSERNFTCCLHEIEFQAGHLIEDNIKTYMKKSLKTIVLLSENFKNSYWCHIEMTEIVQLHMDNKGFPPIILKLDSCMVPEALMPYTYMLLQAGFDDKMPDVRMLLMTWKLQNFQDRCLPYHLCHYLASTIIKIPLIHHVFGLMFVLNLFYQTMDAKTRAPNITCSTGNH
ncbi:unnamed protein product [Mytilus edulis]|uniref:TIR domain-containing protein n=1 Tax=Mytilus edulis TaxID=6550 RepID=A0A8S3SMF5_MYTED|nr:unnamed protein product [Mytilus edulis]